MSVMGPRGRILTMVAVGVLGAGCGAEESQQEALPSQAVPLASSSGWTVLGGMVPGTVYSDELMDVVVEPSTGDVLVAGYENGRLGMTSVDPSGNARGVIMRYDSNLSMMQEKLSIDSAASAEVVQALALSPTSSDIYFVGRTTGSFNGTPNAGQYDTLVGWVDSTNSRKIFQFGHERPEHPVRLALDPTGALIVSGHTDTYIPSNYVEAWEDPFVLKLRREENNGVPTLTPAWELPFNTAQSDILPGMAVDSAANIYVSGANPSGTSRGMYVRQLNADGTMGWYMQQSAVSLDMAAALSISPTNGNHLLMAGSTYALLGERQFGQQDAVVRMLDKTTRTILWTHQYGSEESEWVTDMTQDAQGNIYVVGETLGSFDPAVLPQGDYDIFVLKLDANGLNPQVFQIGSGMDDHPSAVAVDASGAIYVVGYSSGSLIQGQTNKGGRDSFLLKLVPPAPDDGIGI